MARPSMKRANPLGALLLRCDASRQTGLGHLSRCLALADEWKLRGGHALFLMRSLQPDFSDLVRTRGHRARFVEDASARGTPAAGEMDPLPKSDAEAVVAVADEIQAECIVIDTYLAGDSYVSCAKRGAWQILVIDDESGRKLCDADVVVDVARTVPRTPRWLVGPSSALLHAAFGRQRQQRTPQDRSGLPRKILLALGTAGGPELPLRIAHYVRDLLPNADVFVVVTQTLSPLMAESQKGLEFGHSLTPDEMAQRMAWADLAIATPSTVAWELATVGVPSILKITVDNQTPVADRIAEDTVAPIAETVEELERSIKTYLALDAQERRARSDRFRALCDGGGCVRAVDELLAPRIQRPAGSVQ